MHDADDQQRERAAVVEGPYVLATLGGAKRLNPEPDAEQQAEQGVEATLDQVVLQPGKPIVHGVRRVTRPVPVVQVRPEDAEHCPAPQQVERLNSFAWRHGCQVRRALGHARTGGAHTLGWHARHSTPQVVKTAERVSKTRRRPMTSASAARLGCGPLAQG